MKLFLIASLLAALAFSSARFIQPSQLIDRDEQIDPKIRVKWHVDSVAETVSFEVIAETTGWVGFGISKSGGMLGADIVIGGVDGGVTYFEDRFSSGPSGLPSIDPQQDYDLESVVEAGGFTTLKFSRKFDTGDATRDIVIEYDGVVFIWAYGDTDKIEYHVGRRGTYPVNILEGLILPSTSTESGGTSGTGSTNEVTQTDKSSSRTSPGLTTIKSTIKVTQTEGITSPISSKSEGTTVTGPMDETTTPTPASEGGSSSTAVSNQSTGSTGSPAESTTNSSVQNSFSLSFLTITLMLFLAKIIC